MLVLRNLSSSLGPLTEVRKWGPLRGVWKSHRVSSACDANVIPRERERCLVLELNLSQSSIFCHSKRTFSSNLLQNEVRVGEAFVFSRISNTVLHSDSQGTYVVCNKVSQQCLFVHESKILATIGISVPKQVEWHVISYMHIVYGKYCRHIYSVIYPSHPYSVAHNIHCHAWKECAILTDMIFSVTDSNCLIHY